MIPRKVLVYATHEGRIALLYHPDHPEAGVQVPGGSVEPGESVEGAARRELLEETGLRAVGPVRVVGEHEYDMSCWGRGKEYRTYVHVKVEGVPSSSWEWEERSPSTGEGPIRLEVRMARQSSLPRMIAGHDSFVEAVAPGRERGD